MKKTTRRVLLAVLIAVFLVSGGMMLRQLGDYQQGDETYGSAESLAGLPDFSAISWPEDTGSGSAAYIAAPMAGPSRKEPEANIWLQPPTCTSASAGTNCGISA